MRRAADVRRLRRLAIPGGLCSFVLIIAATQPTGSSCTAPPAAAQVAATAANSPGGTQVTASTFGGPGDPATGSKGYKGDNLYQKPDSFAELNMGTALGNLPYMTAITVTYQGKSIVLYKRDIGLGGPGLNGTVRAVDVWFQSAQQLGLPGLAVVTVHVGKSPGAAAPVMACAGPAAASAAALVGSGGVVFPFPKNAPGIAPVSRWTLDQGVDISAPGGTPELAIASGTIVQEGIGGFGPNAPILKLDQPISVGGQSIAYVYYGHAGPDLVPVGAHVQAGQQITIVGYGIVGISTGPHIEFGGMPTQAIPGMQQTSPAVKQLLLSACGNQCP